MFVPWVKGCVCSVKPRRPDIKRSFLALYGIHGAGLFFGIMEKKMEATIVYWGDFMCQGTIRVRLG